MSFVCVATVNADKETPLKLHSMRSVKTAVSPVILRMGSVTDIDKYLQGTCHPLWVIAANMLSEKRN